MNLVERHIIKRNNIHYKELRNLLHLSKNLYNAMLYEIRQYYFQNKKYLSYIDINRKFTLENNTDYRALPAQVAQQTMRMVDKNFKSFFQLRKKGMKAKIPKYLDKQGYFELIYTNQIFSYKNGIVKLGKSNIQFKVLHDNIRQIRFIPCNGHIIMEAIYFKQEKEYKQNNNIMGIDLGIDNLATCVSNTFKHPIIINGKPVKSMNQYYNKKLSEYSSNKVSKRLKNSLNLKRQNKLNDYFHKSTRHITNQAVSNNITTIVIGYNKQWKQDVNLGYKNNQKFVFIPHARFVSILKYKCKLEGIEVIEINEAYTSKASYLDNDFIPNLEDKIEFKFSGKRKQRGLYVSKDGIKINADVNGACNILRKFINKNEVWNAVKLPDRGSVLEPLKISF